MTLEYLDSLRKVIFLCSSELELAQAPLDNGRHRFLSYPLHRAVLGMTTVIYVALLELTDQRIPAVFPGDVSAKKKIVDLGSPLKSSPEQLLHATDQALRDQRLMIPAIDFA